MIMEVFRSKVSLSLPLSNLSVLSGKSSRIRVATSSEPPPNLLRNLLRKKNGGGSEEFSEEMEEKLKGIFICRNNVIALNEN